MLRPTRHGDHSLLVRLKPLNDYRVQIVFCSDLVKAKNSRSKAKAKEIKAIAFTQTFENKYSRIYFTLDKADAGTIAHECYHAVVNVLDYLEAKQDEEIVAYVLDYLVGEVTKFKEKLITALQKPARKGAPSKAHSA
jgi:predicted MPP superfamily phosphohydrolase